MQAVSTCLRVIPPSRSHDIVREHELGTMRTQLEDWTSGHRLNRYDFGGIDMLVILELDAVRGSAAVGSTGGSTGRVSTSDEIKPAPLPSIYKTKAGIKVY